MDYYSLQAHDNISYRNSLWYDKKYSRYLCVSPRETQFSLKKKTQEMLFLKKNNGKNNLVIITENPTSKIKKFH